MSATEKFLKEHPYCCYCGGHTRATTRDHIPPKIIFDAKHRPKGLEVPACLSCNSRTRTAEQIAAMLSRVMTDPTTKTQRKDLDKIFKAVQNNCPELLPEMTASSRQQKKFSASGITGHALNASGPILKSAINLFARKMTLALHYNLANKIVPFNSGVAVEWFTNYQALTNGLPPNLSDMLGPPDTLKQGSFEVSEQFFYQWTISADQNAGIYFAAFRKSFAILGACHPNKRWMEKQDWPTASIFDVFEAPK